MLCKYYFVRIVVDLFVGPFNCLNFSLELCVCVFWVEANESLDLVVLIRLINKCKERLSLPVELNIDLKIVKINPF